MYLERWYNNDRYLSSDKISVSELKIKRKKEGEEKKEKKRKEKVVGM